MKLLEGKDTLDSSDVFIWKRDSLIPISLSNFVELSENHLSITSDLTGQKEISVFIKGHAIIIADDLNKLVRYIHQHTQETLTLRVTSISHLLHDAIVPSPYTIYNEIFSLVVGNIIFFNIQTQEYEIKEDYPYLRSLSRLDSPGSTKTLLNLMANSISEGTKNREPVLMLSSGKDSVSLAIACGEIDLKCKAVTYKSNKDDDESYIAQKIAKKFGLDHEVLAFDQLNQNSLEELMINFFQESVHPCVDFAQLGYLQTLMLLGSSNNTILDGTGNDAYFGGAPCKTDSIKYRFKIGNSKIADSIKPFIRHSYKMSYLLRSDAEINFATRTFRFSDSNKWFNNAFNTSEYWRNRYSSKHIHNKSDLETYYIDLEALVRGRDYDRSCCFLKARMAANFTHNKMYYPYCNEKLIDYCFNLPEKYRFNMKTHKNKLLLRELLDEKVQYSSLERNKMGFDFEGRNFIAQHKSFIKNEILNCNLWERDKISVFLDKSFKLLDHNYYESHGIIVLFLLSGWLNHNKYLNS